MTLFRFPHIWPTIVPPDSDLAPTVPLLDERDRALEDHLATELGRRTELFDTMSALVGTAPSASIGGFLVQAGTGVAAGASPFTLTFTTPFPTGVLTVVACFGDAPGASVFYVDNVSTGGFRFTSAAAVAHRVNWIAIGW